MRKYITIPAAHFHPSEDGYDYYNYGRYLYFESGIGGDFIAPVVFPGSGPVTVRKVTLYGYDNNASTYLSVDLFKTNPSAGSKISIARVETSGASSTGPREFSTTSMTYATIQRTHGAYLWLDFNGSSGLSVEAVKIAYTD